MENIPMVGKLTLNQKDGDYGILEVSEEFKKSVFDAIYEDGMEYDLEHAAHISVFNEKEVEQIKEEYGEISEEGEYFEFFLKSVEK